MFSALGKGKLLTKPTTQTKEGRNIMSALVLESSIKSGDRPLNLKYSDLF